MLDRLGRIGEIRDMIEALHDEGRFELVKEIMGDLDRFNLAGVPDKEISRLWLELSGLPERCHYCRTGEGASCNCV